MVRVCNESPERKTYGDDAVTYKAVTFGLLKAPGITRRK
jgi:hypothetical protein